MQLIEIEDLAGSTEWTELWRRDTYQHPWYMPKQLAVSATHNPSLYYVPPHLRPLLSPDSARKFESLSLLARDDLGPVLGLTLSIEHISDQVRLSAFGRPLCPIEDAAASGPRRKSAAKIIHSRLEQLRDEYSAIPYQIRDLVPDGRMSFLSELVLRSGGSARPFFTQMIDLTLSLNEIRMDLRDSIRNLVRRERADFRLELVTSENVSMTHTDVLRHLHLMQYGHELRPSNSWAPLYDGVRSDSGFFLFGLIGGDYAAGAYFPYSSKYCHYSIAANDPAKYGSGLSCLLLWRAIEHSRKLGCDHLEIGDRIYPTQHNYIEKKFHSISHFKSGFGSQIAARLDITSCVDADRLGREE